MPTGLPHPCAALLAAAGNEALIVLAAAAAMTVVFLIVLLVVVRRLLIVCPPNRLAVISGRPHRRPDGTIVGYRLCRGGRVIRLPILERVDFLELSSIALAIRVQGVRMRDTPEPIDAELSARVKVSSDPVRVHDAVERFLGREQVEVALVARETLEGGVRAVLAQLTLDDVRSDRIRFEQAVVEEIDGDCAKLGIEIDGLRLVRIGPAAEVPPGPSPMTVPDGV
jgi:flotillin